MNLFIPAFCGLIQAFYLFIFLVKGFSPLPFLNLLVLIFACNVVSLFFLSKLQKKNWLYFLYFTLFAFLILVFIFCCLISWEALFKFNLAEKLSVFSDYDLANKELVSIAFLLRLYLSYLVFAVLPAFLTYKMTLRKRKKKN